MPVLKLSCPDCAHVFQSLVMEATLVPAVWVCSQCGSRRAQPQETVEHSDHPWAGGGSGSMCPCCG